MFTSSTSIGALCIKYFTSANWAHVGMIVKNPCQKILDDYYVVEGLEEWAERSFASNLPLIYLRWVPYWINIGSRSLAKAGSV